MSEKTSFPNTLPTSSYVSGFRCPTDLYGGVIYKTDNGVKEERPQSLISLVGRLFINRDWQGDYLVLEDQLNPKVIYFCTRGTSGGGHAKSITSFLKNPIPYWKNIYLEARDAAMTAVIHSRGAISLELVGDVYGLRNELFRPNCQQPLNLQELQEEIFAMEHFLTAFDKFVEVSKCSSASVV